MKLVRTAIGLTTAGLVDRHTRAIQWRALSTAALLAGAACVVVIEVSTAGHANSPPGLAHRLMPSRRLAVLPQALQGVVSSTLGASDANYQIRRAGERFEAQNAPQKLRVQFSGQSVSVHSSSTRVALRLQEMGYGDSLRRLRAVSPSSTANRLVYAYPGVSEWYRNGPFGLEQGFTVPRAPIGHPTGPLTLSMALAGNAVASLQRGDHTLVLRHRGGPSLRYRGLAAIDARGRRLHSWLELRNRAVLVHVDTMGARYPVRIDPFVQQQESLTDPAGSEEAMFGQSVALSSDGRTALIGAPGDRFFGAAWVFSRTGSAWSEQAELTSPKRGSSFGEHVALSSDGDTALVSDMSGGWVYTHSGSTWVLQGQFPGGEDILGGIALSGDGDTAMLGEPCTGEMGCHSGVVRVFVRSGSTWTQQQELHGNGEGEEDGFGGGVALSSDGSTALIGARGSSNKEGAGWVFIRSGNTWTTQAVLTSSTIMDRFTTLVALSADGNTALLGGNEGTSVYTRSGSTWSQQGGLITVEGVTQSFGGPQISSDGNTALISGTVFRRTGSTWTQQETLPREEVKEFAESAVLSGDASTVLFGGREVDEWRGAAWVFTFSSNWPAPVAQTGSASSISQSTATLNATVNPQGGEVSDCRFEYGSSTTYGSSVACGSLPGLGIKPVPVSTAVTGLQLATTYHFRIAATNSGGTSYGADATFTTLAAPPSITKLSIGNGPSAGGTTVAISGKGFTGASAVKFGSISATSVQVNSASSITAVAPGETARTVDVTVTTVNGTSNPISADHFRFTPPTITNVTPSSGSKSGGMTVTVTGTGFGLGAEATAFKFGSTEATTVSCTSSTTCSVAVPSHALGTVDVKANTAGGGGSTKEAADQFTYN